MSELKSYINRVLGNSLRCLLPSYWWKRLFGLVVDRIDEVESTLSTSIDEAKRDVDIPILESKEDLENLDVPMGKLAAVIGKGRSFRECYQPTDYVENIYDLLTHIPNINVLDGPITRTVSIGLITRNASKTILLNVDSTQQGVIAYDTATNRVYSLSQYRILNEGVLQEFNDLLSSDEYCFSGGTPVALTEDDFDVLDKLIRWDVSSDAYIKGGSWERLVKERDLGSTTGSVVFYAPVLGDLTEEQKMKNREAYQKVVDANGIIDIKLNFLLLLQTPSLISFDSSNNIVLTLVATTGGSKYIVSPDGNVTVESIEIPEANGGVEIREFHVSQLKQLGQIVQETQLTDEQKAYNLETFELVRQNKAIASVNLNGGWVLLSLIAKEYGFLAGCYGDGQKNAIVEVQLREQGDCYVESINNNLDDELSDTSENAVQNKVVTAALKNKVDKVDGKQLSTEDFTSLLKAKLEGLSNYDDSTIKNAINSLTTQINTLVSGDASVAIESFNEIIAFLNGIEDSESLDSIIAAIEQQIAGRATTAMLEEEITNMERQITGVAATIPQKTSQLNNDSGFTTEAYVNTQVRTAIISALNTEV